MSRVGAAWSEEFTELVRRVRSSEVGANFEIDLAAGRLNASKVLAHQCYSAVT
jgi:hypothetical protein